MSRISVWNPWSLMSSPWDIINDEDYSPIQLPPMDIMDMGDKILVKIQIPGFKKEDIKITIENTKLIISGSMEVKEKEEDKKKYYKREIQLQRSFTRSCTLPSEVDSENGTAEFINGELQVTLPKAAKAKPQTISIVETK